MASGNSGPGERWLRHPATCACPRTEDCKRKPLGERMSKLVLGFAGVYPLQTVLQTCCIVLDCSKLILYASLCHALSAHSFSFNVIVVLILYAVMCSICFRMGLWCFMLNVTIHNLPHFRVSSKHVAGSISEGVMCLTWMLCRCLSRFGPKRGS